MSLAMQVTSMQVSQAVRLETVVSQKSSPQDLNQTTELSVLCIFFFFFMTAGSLVSGALKQCRPRLEV